MKSVPDKCMSGLYLAMLFLAKVNVLYQQFSTSCGAVLNVKPKLSDNSKMLSAASAAETCPNDFKNQTVYKFKGILFGDV